MFYGMVFYMANCLSADYWPATGPTGTIQTTVLVEPFGSIVSQVIA